MQIYLIYFSSFQERNLESVSVSNILKALKTCTTSGDLGLGRKIHSQAADSGHDTNVHVANKLINMYGRCGSLEDARTVFHNMPRHTSVSWNTLINLYVENDKPELALETFHRIECVPDAHTFVAALKACIRLCSQEPSSEVDGKLVKLGCLATGMEIHSRASASGHGLNLFVGISLVEMYVKCGDLNYARMTFMKLPVRNTVSWNVLILGHAENGEAWRALELFHSMKKDGCEADAGSFVAAVKSCSLLAESEEGAWVDGQLVKDESLSVGTELHSEASRAGLDKHVFVANTLISMYFRCGESSEARRTFECMLKRSVVSWNALIQGYVESGEEEVAFGLFLQMESEGFSPDDRSFVAALKACSCLAARESPVQLSGKPVKVASLEKGLYLHARAVATGVDRDTFVGASLVEMYSRCGSLRDAEAAFGRVSVQSLGSWTSMVAGYVENGEELRALKLLACMEAQGFTLDTPAYISALKACSGLATKEEGDKSTSLERVMFFHARAQAGGFTTNCFLANTLLDTYSACGSVIDALRVFNRMNVRSVVSWNALLLGCAENHQEQLVMELFSRMHAEGCQPNARTLCGVLKGCTSPESVRELHSKVCRLTKQGRDVMLERSLLEAYSRSGSMESAQRVFDALPCAGVVAWNELILGYSRRCDARLVFDTFQRMHEEGCRCDGVSLVGVLATCSHAGLLDRGREVFESMEVVHGVSPCVEHYVCMIDMFGRANRLEEAVALVRCLPVEDRGAAWVSALSRCQTWKELWRLHS